MTHKEFTLWLQGFTEALKAGPGAPDATMVLDKIQEKIKGLEDEPADVVHIPIPRAPSSVPFNPLTDGITYCSSGKSDASDILQASVSGT
jgi:hypothetical protein